MSSYNFCAYLWEAISFAISKGFLFSSRLAYHPLSSLLLHQLSPKLTLFFFEKFKVLNQTNCSTVPPNANYFNGILDEKFWYQLFSTRLPGCRGSLSSSPSKTFNSRNLHNRLCTSFFGVKTPAEMTVLADSIGWQHTPEGNSNDFH